MHEATETIIHEVDGLRQLVDEFSRFARMPALVPKPTDVRAAGRRRGRRCIASRTRALAIRPRLARICRSLEVDPDHIKRAVLNLVDNAVEAVGGTGEVAVRDARAARGRAGCASWSADNGPGIPAEDRERLFLPYFSTKVTGMGLGLPIVHQIVTEHGGTISVEDNAPRGSRFVIELPGGADGAAPVEA